MKKNEWIVAAVMEHSWATPSHKMSPSVSLPVTMAFLLFLSVIKLSACSFKLVCMLAQTWPSHRKCHSTTYTKQKGYLNTVQWGSNQVAYVLLLFTILLHYKSLQNIGIYLIVEFSVKTKQCDVQTKVDHMQDRSEVKQHIVNLSFQ